MVSKSNRALTIAGGLGLVVAAVLLLVVWFYYIMYEWLWLGLMGSHGIGEVIGLTILFLVFLSLSVLIAIISGFLIIAGVEKVAP